MSSVYRGKGAGRRGFASGGMATLPSGSQLLTVEAKKAYELVPFHVYHPTPHEAITILRSKKDPHDWLVCGWYLDTLREGGRVKGLVYLQVTSEVDMEFVRGELKRHDKEGVARFQV